MGEGVSYGVMPFPFTGCSEPDVGFNYSGDLYQMLNNIDTFWI